MRHRLDFTPLWMQHPFDFWNHVPSGQAKSDCNMSSASKREALQNNTGTGIGGKWRASDLEKIQLKNGVGKMACSVGAKTRRQPRCTKRKSGQVSMHEAVQDIVQSVEVITLQLLAGDFAKWFPGRPWEM